MNNFIGIRLNAGYTLLFSLPLISILTSYHSEKVIRYELSGPGLFGRTESEPFIGLFRLGSTVG